MMCVHRKLVRERGSNNHRYLKHDQSQMSKHDQAKAMLPNETQIYMNIYQVPIKFCPRKYSKIGLAVRKSYATFGNVR